MLSATTHEKGKTMRPGKRKLTVLLAALILLTGTLGVAQRPESPLRYELHLGAPNTHLLEITIHAGALRGGAAEFAMPAWAPGSYRISDYAKMVQEFSAVDIDGKPLAWQKTDKQTWRVALDGAHTVTVRYKLYGNTLANNWVQYNDQHAFIAGPAAWMYLVGGKHRPVELTIAVPAGWRVATGMRRTGENQFAADDYDWFADSPIEISDWQEQTFDAAGTTYHVVVHDILGKKDFSKFAGDAKKVVETIVTLFGGRAPFTDYWFLFHIWPGTGGGLEHLNSTQINFPTSWDGEGNAGRLGSNYQSKLFVTAHEFFHAWNVKRLRPLPLGPFDYSREVHTPSLWISEGLTSYYGQLAMVRAGLYTPEQYLNSIADLITDFEQQPGRNYRSIAETSWDTWFQNSPPGDTNLRNTNYSYYDAGQIVGHLLDFAIRQATQNRRSLDDWMRLLYERHALPKPGFTPDDAVRAASEVAGRDMSEFFRRYITGKDPLPYEEYFAYAGIQVERQRHPERAWFGATLQDSREGWAQVSSIIPGSPAEAAGLDRNDIVLGIGQEQLNASKLMQALEKKSPGDTVELTVVRWGQKKTLRVTLAAYPYATFVLSPLENPTPLQRAIYESWLGLDGRSSSR
jgi:predicted metalloprotease with PDZ domain